MQFAEQYCFSGDDPFMASTTVSYSHTRKGGTKQVSLPKQGKAFSIMEKHSSCISQCGLHKDVGTEVSGLKLMPWWWSSSVCASIPCFFPSYSLSRATQSASLSSRIEGGMGSQVAHGKAKPQVSLVGCPDGVASAEAPDWYLRAQTAVESPKQRGLLLASIATVSFGFTSWEFGWNLGGGLH